MAEAEVTITYREFPVVVANWAFMIALPVVTLYVLLTTLTIWSVESVSVENASIFVFFQFLLLGSVILGNVLTADKTVYLTRDGISLPFLLSPCFGLRSQKSWDDLNSLRITASGNHGIMHLGFRNGAKARLRLDALKESEIENLIVSMEVWAGGGDAFPALLDARMKLLPNSESNSTPGFTEMWEEELTRRFGPTNFIPLEPGHKVGAFTVERQFAFGGLSAIYLVADENHQHFVLKEAVVPSDANDEMRQVAENMLNREAEILSALKHPNLARVLDNFVESGRHYILMELIKGSDLRRLVKEHGPQPEADVVVWAKQLAETLAYLHAQTPPVIHRDLSPDNLMLREDGTICVIDFGAANHFVGTATGTLIGKQSYIAPEQLRGKAEPRSDVYAFGCTLNFLLTGEEPEPLAVAHPKMQNSAVSGKMNELVAACTAQEAEDRPVDAQALRAALERLV